MANLKSRVEQLEEKQWREAVKQLNCTLNGRSLEDIKFFCVHGYLPEVPIPGHPVDTSNWGCTWEEIKRFTAGRSLEDKVYFAVHGCWPEPAQHPFSAV